MIYLDNGATTFPKPSSVINAVNSALKNFGANPGRGGHKMAMKASELVYKVRSDTAEFFGASDPSQVVFALNCTEALNIVIKGLLKNGDHVIISSLEHNAVLRPVVKLKDRGVSYSIAEVFEGDDDKTLDNFRNEIRDNTKLMICTSASNVFGIKPPYERLCALCHQYGIKTCVDAAQGAGIFNFNLSSSSIDYLCVAGHKGLYSPMGVGVLIINCDTIPDSLTEGGTGSNSSEYIQPNILPDKFESGTVNFSGIIGLGEGIKFVKQHPNIYLNEIKHIQRVYNSFKSNDNIKLYTDYPEIGHYAPVLSFNIEGVDCEQASKLLSSRYNIAVRAGLHCAPLAHKSKNTLSTGTIRAVPSAFTTASEINRFIFAVYNIK